jgi:short-subunit dehydrogenase
LPAIRASGNGRVLNVASFAALVPGADGQTLYAAVKAYLVKFSESLSLENLDRGVHVTSLCPGFTWSEFHDVTGTRSMMSRMPGWMWMTAPDVARQGYDAVMADRPLLVTGRVNSTIATLVRVLPQRLVIAVGRRIGREYRKA